MVQEVYNQRCIELFKMQFRRWNLKISTGVFKEELESIRIGLTGVIAGATLDWQALLQKGSDVRCNLSHGCPPVTKFSQHSAMLLIRFGVASRYQ